jgi:glycolate oxidase FAD binding subunit
MMLQPASIEEAQEMVRAHERLIMRGAGTKPSLSSPFDDVHTVDLSHLSGVIEYQPEEYTFTALAGTPVREVQALLAQNRQYLPFDPLLARRGATLGGTVAAGASGPGRYRYGGIRDFLLGVRFLDGEGALVRGGGKVVKNAAGFDIPKLMVGSMGELGVLLELTFKVFPRSEAFATLRAQYDALDGALDALARLGQAPLELDAVELDPPGTLSLRVGGLRSSLSERIERVRTFLGRGEFLEGEDEASFWDEARELAWASPDQALVRVPLTPRRIPEFDACLVDNKCQRRYSVGGNVAWVTWPGVLGDLDAILAPAGLSGLVLFGPAGSPVLGRSLDNVFARRLKSALDSSGRFASRGLSLERRD